MENVYCGVDLHYRTSTFRFLDEDGQTRQSIEIETDKAKIEALLERYRDFRMAYAFEAGNMTHYFHRIISHLENTGKIHVVHPYKFKVITESKRKNDKEDSLQLAKGLLKEYLPNPVYIKSESYRQLRALLNLRRRMVGGRAKIILQAKSILRSLGVKDSHRDLKSKHGFARAIFQLNDDPFFESVIEKMSLECGEETNKLTAIEQQIRDLIDLYFSEENQWLISIPGISFVTAATVLSVVDDVNRFQHAAQFSSYCGLVPSERSSGDKIVRGRITKEGVKELRFLFTQAAWAIVKMKKLKDERITRLMKKFYRMSYKQKNTQKAVTAVARHLSRIAFGVLKNKMPYCGELANKVKACC
ncbi:MAG: IS110 family transposase [bacterium]